MLKVIFETKIFSATQRCNVVTIRNNVATMLQRCVALKVVVANRLVQHHLKRRRQRERWKNNNSKKATFHVQHTFLYISLPLFCTTTTWNFQKLPGYTFYGGNVARVLAFLIFSPPLQNFMIFLQQKMSPLFFLSRSCSFSRWASLAVASPSPFLCLSLSLFSKCVDTTINLNLIL